MNADQQMTITVTSNEYNTLFIEMEGALVADSAVFNRKRGFNNKVTGQWVYARDFTPAKVRRNPELVLAYLAKTGTLAVGRVVVAV